MRFILAIPIVACAVTGASAARAWGPHSEITRAAINALPANCAIRAELGTHLRDIQQDCWMADWKADVRPDFYVDDYLLFPSAPRYIDHLVPDVKTAYSAFFHQALWAMRHESPENAERWLGSLVHFTEDSGSPPHADSIRGPLHTKMENWLDSDGITISDYSPKSLGADDDSALQGYLTRMDGLIAYSRQRGEALRGPLGELKARADQPLILESANEVSRVVADLLLTLGELTRRDASGGGTLSGQVTAPNSAYLHDIAARVVIRGTNWSTDTVSGRFEFRHLPAGKYGVSVLYPGSAVLDLPPVEVADGQSTTQDARITAADPLGNRLRNPNFTLHWIQPDRPDAWRSEKVRIGGESVPVWQADNVGVTPGVTYRIGASFAPGQSTKLAVRWTSAPSATKDVSFTILNPPAAGASSVEQLVTAPPKAVYAEVLLLTDADPAKICRNTWCVAEPNAASALSEHAASGVVFVSPKGDDHWSGLIAAPNADHTDGPFRTIGHALSFVHGAATGGARVVRLEGGMYVLDSTLTLGVQDGGRDGSSVLITADKPGEAPILTGGSRLSGWTNVGGNRWQVTLPDVAAGKWFFSQLYVNGERRYRPRLPKQGYDLIAEEAAPSPKAAGKGYDRFTFKPGDIDANWVNRGDIEILPFHIWTMSRFGIADIDSDQNILTINGIRSGNNPWSHLLKGGRYLVENVKEALREPGEWYLDRPTGVLTYLVKPGEDPNRDVIVAPRIDQLAKLDGVANLTFHGITFADAGWNIGPRGNSSGQADTAIPAAITLTDCHNVVFENCVVRNIGNYAIDFGTATQDCRLDHCSLIDLGAGGVKIGTSRNEPDSRKQAGHNSITDCLIAESGRVHPSSVAIWIGQSANNTVDHNEITDTYYTAISAGWTWGYAPNAVHDNVVSYNKIHKIGQGVLSDMGGIYTLGMMPGTVLDHNIIDDVVSFDYGGWGIYFDEGSTGITATNNVVSNCKSASFHQHYGVKNLLENNILARGSTAQLMRTRADNIKSRSKDEYHVSDELSFTIRRNIIYWDNGAPLFGSNWSGSNFALADNIYWDADPSKPIVFPNKAALASWQTSGEDKGSIVADPEFVAPKAGDFALRPGSPASKIGFMPIDVTAIGPRGMAPYSGNATPAFPTAK